MKDEQKLSKIYLLVLAFVCGATIMSIEITANRLMAPYFGSSTIVWTNIIGLILAALALGYYFGGKISEQKPELTLLLKIILVSCIFLFFIPFLIKTVVGFLAQPIFGLKSATLFIFLGSFLTALVLFAFPIILLGMTSPFIIKLLSLIDPLIGKDAGLVFSVSTLGSLLGTFLPTLLLIPFLGSRKTIMLSALLLFCLALFGLIKEKIVIAGIVLLIPCIMFAKNTPIKTDKGIVYEDESVYQYMQVKDKDDFRILLVNEGMGLFSLLKKDGPHLSPGLTGTYFDYYNLLPYLMGNKQKQNLLILGLAGGTISTQLNHFFAKGYDLKIDGVEVDKKIINLGRRYFLLENPSLVIHNRDGRDFLRTSQQKYDIIIIDVFANQLYIPFHMTTQEFFELVKQHLQPGGIVAMNVVAASEQSFLLKNITNTIHQNLPFVYLVKTNSQSWNFLVLGSGQEIDFQKLSCLDRQNPLFLIAQKVFDSYQKTDYDPRFGILTDDKAPIEFMTDWMLLGSLL